QRAGLKVSLLRSRLMTLRILLGCLEPGQEVVLGWVDVKLAAQQRMLCAAIVRTHHVPDVRPILGAVRPETVPPRVAVALGVGLGRLEPQWDRPAGHRVL